MRDRSGGQRHSVVGGSRGDLRSGVSTGSETRAERQLETSKGSRRLAENSPSPAAKPEPQSK
jgi:hypothetical protein